MESNIACDWLNHTVKPIRRCVISNLQNVGEIDRESFTEWLSNTTQIVSFIHR